MAATPVRVALRVRPLLGTDSDWDHICMTFLDETHIRVDSDRFFTFDYIFPPEASQTTVFETSVMPLLNHFLEGQNVTVFAFGHTGSGKTYSMGTGNHPAEDSGIVQRFAESLFHALLSKQGEQQVYASFLELYNEEVHDLLQARRPNDDQPSIRQDAQGNMLWADIIQERTQNAEELLGCLRRGVTYRITESTDANKQSSRSHAIFSVVLKQKLGSQRLASRFQFVDLAVSEAANRTMVCQTKEGIVIDTGLQALKNVIWVLGDKSRKDVQVPYRESKLTRLMQDSLGGNCLALMLACVSPTAREYVRTVITLKFATRARNIENRVEINHDDEGSLEELSYLRNRVSQLEMQVAILQEIQRPSIPAHWTDTLFQEQGRLRDYAKRLTVEMARIQSERDTLKLQLESAHGVPIDSAHPLIQSYVEKTRVLQFELEEAHHRLEQIQASNALSFSRADTLEWHQINTLHTRVSSSMGLPGRYSQSRHVRRPHPSLSMSRGRRRPVPLRHRMVTRSSSRRHNPIPFALMALLPSMSSPSGDTFERSMNQRTTVTRAHHTPVLSNETVAHMSPGIEGSMPHPHSHATTAASATTAVSQTRASSDGLDCGSEDEGDLEALCVPSWTNMTRAQSTNASTKRGSMSWTDSQLDDSERSVTSSPLSTAASGTERNAAIAHHRDSRDMLKMLHQAQADLLVKKELVGQLEKSEDEINQMRVNYQDRLNEMQNCLEETEKEKQQALQHHGSGPSRPSAPSTKSVVERHTMQHADQVRRLYESKINKLAAESQEWQRKYTQTNHTLRTARVKAQDFIDKLKNEMEALKLEKKQMTKAVKQETDKAREAALRYEREIQQIRRREAAALDGRKKAEEAQEAQALLLKKRTEDLVASKGQLSQLLMHLRKAASEGLFLNETSLEKLLNGNIHGGNNPGQRSTRSPIRHSSPSQ